MSGPFSLAANLLGFENILYEFQTAPDTLARATDAYRPSTLADFLFDLAGAYSTYYQNLPFLKAPDGVRESRVLLKWGP